MSISNHIRQVIYSVSWENEGVFSRGTSWCGREIWRYEMPVELDVAKIMIDGETWAQPCKHCMKAALKAESEGN